jgi:hypothetical protein
MKVRFIKLLQVIPLNLIVFLAGIVLFYYGIYRIYPPAAFIGAGIILMGISIFGEHKL